MLPCHFMGRGDVDAKRPQTTSYFQLSVTSRFEGTLGNFSRNVPFVLLFLLLLIACSSADIPLPQSIGSMRLEKVQSGEEARREIDRLHGKQISFLRGYIGTYVAENGSGQLWVSEHSSERESTEAIEKMAHGMKQGKQQQFRHFRKMMIEQRYYDVFQPDAVFTGGIAQTMEVIRLLRKHDLGYSPHTWTNGKIGRAHV